MNGSLFPRISGTNMTGRPGDHAMEMDGGSTASYLTRTPRITLFMLVFIGLEAKELLDFQGRGITSIVRRNLRPVIFSGISKPVVWGTPKVCTLDSRGFRHFSWFP